MQRNIDVAGLASMRNEQSLSSPAPLKVLRAIEFVAETIVIVALLAELVLVLANVFDRTYFRRSFLWADEAARSFTPTADQKVCATLPANADVVAACTRIIEAQSSSALDRAVSYTFRADAARAGGNA